MAPTAKELEAKLAAAQAEIESLKKASQGEFKMKVTEAGKLSVYGLFQRFPVTLSGEGWLVVVEHVSEVEKAAKDCINAQVRLKMAKK